MGSAFAPGWQAGLELEMARRDGVTRLTHARHWGPLRVQRPFYPDERGDCHLYLLHPPGGMVTGDRLNIDVQLSQSARSLLTSPSAGKIYRGNNTGDSQQQRVRCRVENHSYLEWLPQETIVFDGARGELDLLVELDDSSDCALWDVVCLGRPASGERFTSGYLRQRLELIRAGEPLYIENNCFDGGSELLEAPWGLAGNPVTGTFLVTCSLDEEAVAALRELLADQCVGSERLAVTNLGSLVVVRYIGASPERCRQLFVRAWRWLKPGPGGLDVIEPRIWRT